MYVAKNTLRGESVFSRISCVKTRGSERKLFCQKRAPPVFDKRDFASTRAFSRIKCVKTHSGPTSAVGSAEASSAGPRPAQSFFRDVHAQRKSPWGAPPRKMIALYSPLRRRTLRGIFDSLRRTALKPSSFGMDQKNPLSDRIPFIQPDAPCPAPWPGRGIAPPGCPG